MKTAWIPPADVVEELVYAAKCKDEEAEYVLDNPDDPQRVSVPTESKLKRVIDDYLVQAGGAQDLEVIDDAIVCSAEEVFACLRAAMVKVAAQVASCSSMEKAYKRERVKAENALEALKSAAWEAIEGYGKDDRLETPVGTIRLQKNSRPSVWVDEDRVDEIPEDVDGIRLVKVEKTPVKEAIAQYLEWLEEKEEPAPDWAKILPPGKHLRF